MAAEGATVSTASGNVMAMVGRVLWPSLHYLAFHFPEAPTEEDMQYALAFVNSLTRLLPCRRCRHHWAALVASTLPPRVDCRESFARWSVDAHNAVNERLGKPLMSYEQACSIYGGCAPPVSDDSPNVYAMSLPGVEGLSASEKALAWASALPGVDASAPQPCPVATVDIAPFSQASGSLVPASVWAGSAAREVPLPDRQPHAAVSTDPIILPVALAKGAGSSGIVKSILPSGLRRGSAQSKTAAPGNPVQNRRFQFAVLIVVVLFVVLGVVAAAIWAGPLCKSKRQGCAVSVAAPVIRSGTPPYAPF